MSSPMLKLKGPQMARGKHPPAFPLKHAQKDMRFALSEVRLLLTSILTNILITILTTILTTIQLF